MDRIKIIKSTTEYLKKLPNDKLVEIHDFVEFVFSKYDNLVLQEGMKYMSSNSKSLEFLKDEEDLYTVSDVKEEYK
jgi:hypothetical protein